MRKGKFIVLDGIDGCGTTTHSEKLKQWLISLGYLTMLTHEPTTGKIGKLIRDIIKTKNTSPIIDALLFAADRKDHLENIVMPSLAANKIVISDRFIESTVAYQTAAGCDLNWILEINKFVKNPDLTIILDVKPEVGLGRKFKAEDKFEEMVFLRKVREIYLQRAKVKQYPVINTERPISEVQADLQKLIRTIL